MNLDLNMDQKLRSKKLIIKNYFFLCVTIAYLKEYSKIKDFQENSYTEIRTNFLAPKWGVNLYTGKYDM